jgi:GH35 family endo-1,4-beta-xylanase
LAGDGANPVPEQVLKEMMQSYGVPIYVTEMTIDMTDVQGTTAQRFARQAEIKKQYILTAIESGVCKLIFDWGFQDSYNWLEKDRGRPAADPTMYDDALNRKPSYYAELAALMPDN